MLASSSRACLPGILIATALWAPASLPAAPVASEEADAGTSQLHDLYYGVHLPDDRAQSRLLDVATELIGEKRYSEAAPLLLELLANEQDAAYGVRAGSRDDFQSLTAKAREAIDRLDAGGRQSYLLASEAAAHRELKRALHSGDRAQLAQVARRYPASAPAAAAAWNLAQLAADHGNYEKALAWIAVLRANRRYRTDYEPQASLAAAVSLAALGKQEAAETELANADIDPNEARQLLSTAASLSQADTGWSVLGGDRTRTRPAPDGAPHLWAHWRARTLTSSDEAAQIHRLGIARRREGFPTIALASPIAVGDEVIARSSTGLFAVNWRTGRRVWQTRPGETTNDEADELRQILQRVEESPNSIDPFATRIWLDALGSGLSSDGRLIFELQNNYTGRRRASTVWQAPFGGNRRRGETGPVTSCLSAYDPRLQGKLIWQADGASPTGPWSGTFFLCPPLAIDGRLLVVAERDQTIFLSEVHTSTGRAVSYQPLVTVESSAAENPVRRLTGAGLACSGELAVCATGAGVVVAVDLPTQSLRWVHRLPIDAGRRPRTGPSWGRRRERIAVEDTRRRWLENQVMITGNHVLVATPESDQLHCLDLVTGDSLWRRPRGDGVLIAAVSGQRTAVLAPHRVVGLATDDGQQAWVADTPQGASPVGRGLRVGPRLAVPLDDGDLMLVRFDDGDTSRVRTWDGEIGNLIYHRGAIVSQGLTSLDRFNQLPGVLVDDDSPATGGPDPRVGLMTRAERALSEENFDHALHLLMSARGADQTSVLASDRMRCALLAKASTTPLDNAELALLIEASKTKEQKLATLPMVARAAARRGAANDVLATAFAAEKLDRVRETLAPVTGNQRVMPTRQLAGIVADTWAELDEADRARWLDAVGAVDSISRLPLSVLRRRASLFAATPAADPLRTELANRWSSRGDLAHAALAAAPQSPALSASAAPAAASVWSFRQSIARTELRRGTTPTGRSSSRSDRLPSFLMLPVSRCGSTPMENWRYAISNTGQVLMCWDGHGVRQFQLEIPQVGSEMVRRMRSLASADNRFAASPIAWQVGGQLILAGAANVIGIDLFAAARGDDEQAIRWTAVDELRAATDQSRVRRTHSVSIRRDTTAPSTPSLPNRWTAVGASHVGVLIRGSGAVACLDPLTGEPLWLRTDLEVDNGVFFVDGDQALVNLPKSAIRIRMLDGHTGPAEGLPNDWIALENGLLTTVTRDGDAIAVKIVDATSGRTALSERFPKALVARVRRSDELLVATRTERGIEVATIDTGTGRMTQQANVDCRSPVSYVLAERREFGLLVALSRTTRTDLRPIGISPMESGPLLSGPLVCIKDQGQVAWRAELAGLELIDRAPHASPLVVLGRRDHRREQSSVKVTSQLMALDGFTGCSVLHAKQLPEDAVASFRLRYEGGRRPALRARFPRSITEVRVTDAPLPPGPSYHAGVESPTRLSVNDLLGMGQDIWQATGDAIRPKPAEDDDD